MSRMLVVAAHPDDEVLGAGGLIARKLDEGWSVEVLIFCENWIRTGLRVDDALVQIQMCASELYGQGEHQRDISAHVLKYPDQKLELIYLSVMSQDIAHYVADRQYDLVVSHSMTDLNADHRRVAEAVRIFCRGKTLQLWEMFVPSASDVSTGFGFNGNVYVELTEEQLDRKCRAFAFYVEEAKHPMRSKQAIKEWASIWGRSAGVSYAEIFKHVVAVLPVKEK